MGCGGGFCPRARGTNLGGGDVLWLGVSVWEGSPGVGDRVSWVVSPCSCAGCGGGGMYTGVNSGMPVVYVKGADTADHNGGIYTMTVLLDDTLPFSSRYHCLLMEDHC